MATAEQLHADAEVLNASVADVNAVTLDRYGEGAAYIAGLIQGDEDEQNRVLGEAQVLHDLAAKIRSAGPVVTAWADLARTVANAQGDTEPDE